MKRVWQTDDSRKLRFHFPGADYGFLAGLLSNMTVLWFLFTTLLVGQENPRLSQPIRVKNLPPTFFPRLWPVTCMNFEFWFAPCCSDWPWWWFSFCLMAIFLSIITCMNLPTLFADFSLRCMEIFTSVNFGFFSLRECQVKHWSKHKPACNLVVKSKT